MVMPRYTRDWDKGFGVSSALKKMLELRRAEPSRARCVTHLVLAVPPDHLQGRLGYDGSLQDQLGEKPGGGKTRPRV